jgi:hypothetical protein
VGNQNQKIQLKSAEQIYTSEHHKLTNQPPKKSAHTQPQKATHSSEFVANRRLSYNRAVCNGRSKQHHWQLISAGIGVLKLR